MNKKFISAFLSISRLLRSEVVGVEVQAYGMLIVISVYHPASVPCPHGVEVVGTFVGEYEGGHGKAENGNAEIEAAWRHCQPFWTPRYDSQV